MRRRQAPVDRPGAKNHPRPAASPALARHSCRRSMRRCPDADAAMATRGAPLLLPPRHPGPWNALADLMEAKRIAARLFRCVMMRCSSQNRLAGVSYRLQACTQSAANTSSCVLHLQFQKSQPRLSKDRAEATDSDSAWQLPDQQKIERRLSP